MEIENPKIDISLKNLGQSAFSRGMVSLIQRPVLSLLGMTEISRLHQTIAPEKRRENFPATALKALNVTYQWRGDGLQDFPKDKPLIVVSNHPFGGIEGLILLDLIRKWREDTRFLGNFILEKIPEMQDLIVSVDPFGGSAAGNRNSSPMREAIKWLKNGHVLGAFPSGVVSHWHLSQREVVDPAWKKSIAKLARSTNAWVLPLYIDGRNSVLFQLVGFVHPLLRTAFLGREFLRSQHQTVKIELGRPISPSEMAEYECNESLIEFLRLRTYILKNRSRTSKKTASFFNFKFPAQKHRIISAPMACERLRREIDLLGEDHVLARSGKFMVFHATAPQIPNVLNEIGRQREITFREVSEGTGKSCDVDRFDQYYHHVVNWDVEQNRIVGAYRLGKTDEIVAARGIGGLYTSTLFHYTYEANKTTWPFDRSRSVFCCKGLSKGLLFAQSFVERHSKFCCKKSRV